MSLSVEERALVLKQRAEQTREATLRDKQRHGASRTGRCPRCLYTLNSFSGTCTRCQPAEPITPPHTPPAEARPRVVVPCTVQGCPDPLGGDGTPPRRTFLDAPRYGVAGVACDGCHQRVKLRRAARLRAEWLGYHATGRKGVARRWADLTAGKAARRIVRLFDGPMRSMLFAELTGAGEEDDGEEA
jgi:hypothetical protein